MGQQFKPGLGIARVWSHQDQVCASAETDHSNKHSYMWHDQEKWVACRKYSIFSFQYDLLVHFKYYILIQTPLQSNIRFKRYDQFFEFLNYVKHRNFSPLLAYNSKSILAISDSFRLIVSHLSNNIFTCDGDTSLLSLKCSISLCRIGCVAIHRLPVSGSTKRLSPEFPISILCGEKWESWLYMLFCGPFYEPTYMIYAT